MKNLHIGTKALRLFCLIVFLLPGVASAEEKYRAKFERWSAQKSFFDDPRPVLKNYPLTEIIPPGDYAQMVHDTEEMSRAWAEAVGFRAPDVVGGIAPEIVPGRYGFRDKERLRGLKELMLPVHYERFNEGSPPFACNFPEFEVVPTRQVYPTLPVAQATLRNMGKTEQDKQGYMVESSYRNGYPFPRPTGPFKAQQVMVNFRERYFSGDHGTYTLTRGRTWDGSLREIYDFAMESWGLRLSGRLDSPDGWLDERARKRGEFKIVNAKYLSPRDQFGNVTWLLSLRATDQPDEMMIWLAQIRRLRKLSGTDTQDVMAGLSLIFDDMDGFIQKLSPTVYPYEYRIVAEREFLVPHYAADGVEYLSRERLELKNVRMERRPVYVVELLQKDPRYVYGKRVLYIDRETFVLHFIENYDQKGRLWRSFEETYSFYPDLGLINMHSTIIRDYQDPQTTYMDFLNVPANWTSREDTLIGSMVKAGK